MLIAKLSEGNGWSHRSDGGPAFPPLLLGHGLSLLPLGHLSHCTSHWLPWVPGKDRDTYWLGEGGLRG